MMGGGGRNDEDGQVARKYQEVFVDVAEVLNVDLPRVGGAGIDALGRRDDREGGLDRDVAGGGGCIAHGERRGVRGWVACVRVGVEWLK